MDAGMNVFFNDITIVYKKVRCFLRLSLCLTKTRFKQRVFNFYHKVDKNFNLCYIFLLAVNAELITKEEGKNMSGDFEGTFLTEVSQVLAKGQFDSLDLDPFPVEEGEEIIGEMTDLEKAIFVLIYQKIKDHDEMVKSLAGKVPKIPEEKKEELHKLENQLETLRSLGWQVIQDRLDLNRANIGIREGYKIVKRGKESGIIRRSSITIVGHSGFPG